MASLSTPTNSTPNAVFSHPSLHPQISFPAPSSGQKGRQGKVPLFRPAASLGSAAAESNLLQLGSPENHPLGSDRPPGPIALTWRQVPGLQDFGWPCQDPVRGRRPRDTHVPPAGNREGAVAQTVRRSEDAPNAPRAHPDRSDGCTRK